MRRDLLGVLCAVAGSATPSSAEPSYTSASTEPVTGVDTLLVRPTTTALAAALSTLEKNTEFRVTFVPAQFIDRAYAWWFSELRITALADTSTSVTRLAVATGYNPFSLRSQRGLRVIQQSTQAIDCSGFEIGSTEMDACTRKRTASQWKHLNSGWTPSVLLTVSYDLYPYGQVPLSTDPTQETRLEHDGGFGAQLGLELRPRERTRLSGWFTAKHVRPDGAPGTEQATYLGGGITASHVLWTFLPDALDSAPDDYVQEGFLPGVAAGVSAQILDCNGEQFCAKFRTLQWSLTPFVDILGSSKLQLRLSLPITRFDSVDKTGTDISGTFSIAGNIGTP